MMFRAPWKRWSAPVFLAVALSPASSGAGGMPTGAWQGTIGQSRVMVCLAESGESQYYELSHRQGIRLAPSTATGDGSNSAEAIATSWLSGEFGLDEHAPGADGEGDVVGRWVLRAQSPTEITGTWAAPGSGETLPVSLPISLRKAPPVAPSVSTDAGWGCEPAFYAPIRAEMRLTFRPAKVGKHLYREVASDHATALEVPAEWPHAQALNRYALDWLRDQAVLSYECGAGRNFSAPEPTGRSLKPILWTDAYLVLEDLLPEIYCGGAHGSSSLSYLTWSWSQGRQVDTWDWLQGGVKSLVSHAGRQGRPIKGGLFRLIAKLHPRNAEGDDCRDVLDAMSVQAPYPTARGLVFNTSFFHAMRACDDKVMLEWRQLMPYLSVEGRELADQLRHQDP